MPMIVVVLLAGSVLGFVVGSLPGGILAILRRRRATAISVLREEAKTFWLRHRSAIFASGLAVNALWSLCNAVPPRLAASATSLQDPGPGMASLSSAEAGRRVTAFVWTYRFEPEPGLRVWLRDERGRWHEHYPDGHEAKVFDVSGWADVNGCPGSLSHASAEANFEVFVPDVGCPNMTALFRWNGGAWAALGPMTVISSRPLSEG